MFQNTQTIFVLTLLTLMIYSNVSVYGQNRIKEFESISGKELVEILNLDLKASHNEKYSGYYSFYIDKYKNEVLNGSFAFSYHAYAENNEDSIMNSIEYSGNFKDGLKSGAFIESFLYDDGIDIYMEWTISSYYIKSECLNGSFQGIIGHIMPFKRYDFETLCSFDKISDRAEIQWNNEWTKKQTKSN